MVLVVFGLPHLTTLYGESNKGTGRKNIFIVFISV